MSDELEELLEDQAVEEKEGQRVEEEPSGQKARTLPFFLLDSQ